MNTHNTTQKMHTTINAMLSAYARDHGLNVRIATPVHGDAGIVAYELLDDATQTRHVVPVVGLFQTYGGIQ